MNCKLNIFCTLLAALLATNVGNAQIVGMDDFDGNELFLSRTLTPDNSGFGGTFPSSIFDVFGIVNRAVNFDFSDDTLIDPGFTGAFPTTVTDSFLGTEDIENNDNPGGTAEVVYEFDITGASNLVFSASFAAWGNFESANDINTISASIDGSSPELLIEVLVDEEATQTYSYEDGSTEGIDDPLVIQGILLDNSFQNFSAPITGTGNTLTITMSFAGNGGNEVFAINDILIEAKEGKGGMPGDVNCDGVVDLLDVAPFVDLVINGGFNSKADLNNDGVVDLLDVAPFVDLLTGG